ncbi:IMS-domain-containing protein [Suillus paluster]|uniref:IMS-domain-containing protein n=1 Tax=Suillus paluster TaxID=48578 RepID=UPI001B8640F7|nr:IMS-domain-containing protein [Suillus paluster]KAG1731472.1 IMS-domain-containing protein [Suillus paluster]
MEPERPPEPSQDSASLLKRLAGPSSTKAGLAHDQTAINRIIAEASKGSKFYENEKRKDKELSERINKILKQRDEALQGVNLRPIERNIDHLVSKLESQRDLSQIVVHVDMDAFYCSVELLDDPSLQGKPFAVGGGVISTASYDARKYGVRSGMATFVAKKLYPELILLRSNFERYSEMSDKVMDIFERYDPTMLAAGCDEGYLNITEYCEGHMMDADTCVQEIRDTVFRETSLTVSAGIAPNKMLAKICSDKNKPNGQYHLPFDRTSIKAFMHDLSIRKVPGVGRVNERLLEAIGIKNCGDIFKHRATLQLMDKQFGLVFLLRTYLGVASNVVQPIQREERKSIGAERTFHALSNKIQILRKLEEVAEELEHDMVRRGWTGKTVTLKYKLDTFQVFTRAKSFDRWVSSKKEDLFAIGKELLLPELPLTLRLIGLRVTKLKDLNAPEPAGGIKRFFESTNSSPRKRPRLASDTEDCNDDQDEAGEDYESMPGFYEEEENVEGRDLDAPDDEEQNHISHDVNPTNHERRLRPPVSAPGPSRTIPSNSPFPATTSKPMSARQGDHARHQECPICGKLLDTDNKGLNAHIDFCLSRDVIMEAQTEAQSAVKEPKDLVLSWPKGKR